MSTTPTVEQAVDGCRPIERTPVTVDAEALESTAPDYLREVRRALEERGYLPAELAVEACFDADCSLTTQREVDHVREHIRAANFLGANAVRVTVETVSAPEKVRPALAACVERAEREGLSLEVEGALTP